MSRERDMRWYGSLSEEKMVKNLKEGGSQRGIRGKNLLNQGFDSSTNLVVEGELIGIIIDAPFNRISSKLNRVKVTHQYISFMSFVWNGDLPIIRV